MRSYHINMGAGLDGLLLKEHDMPVPGPREVLVRVRACSLNARELLILLQGIYPLPVSANVVPISDGAGSIVAVGKDVTRFKVGDRVAGVVFPYWQDGPYAREASAQLGGSLDGMLTEYAILSESGVVPVPEHLSFEEAATLPCAALTAWNALTGGQPLQTGDTVLVLGSGSVSLFALQFARLFGVRVLALTSSEEKAERMRALGAHAVINYRLTPDWSPLVRELTNGRGVDRVVEVGGPGTIVQSIKATRVSGEVALIGSVASDLPAESGLHSAIFTSFVNVRPIAIGSRAQFLAMNRAIAESGLRPVIDCVFPFEEAKAAYQYYQQARPFGKVVISQN